MSQYKRNIIEFNIDQLKILKADVSTFNAYKTHNV